MSEKISQYIATATSNPIKSKDYLDLSNEDGTGGYDVSKKVKVSEMMIYINTLVNNIYNSNGNQVGNRTITSSGLSCTWDGGTVITKSDGINDNGFLLFDSLNVLKGGIAYDVTLNSATLDLKNAGGSYFLASDGSVRVGGSTLLGALNVKSDSGQNVINLNNNSMTSGWSYDDNGMISQSGTSGLAGYFISMNTGQNYGLQIQGNSLSASINLIGGSQPRIINIKNQLGGVANWVDSSLPAAGERIGHLVHYGAATSGNNQAFKCILELGSDDIALDSIGGDIILRPDGATSGSTASQIGSTEIILEASLWNGASELVKRFSTIHEASVTVDLDSKISTKYDGAEVFAVRNDGVIIIKEFTVATLPANVSGGIIIVTDESGGRTMATNDGAAWRRVKDGVVVS